MCKMNIIVKFLILIVFFSCNNAISQDNNPQLEKYWSDGKAEVNKYELQQNRYNNTHNGHLIQVYVSEDFLLDKQVKNETYRSKESVSILKRIETRYFNTGIYDYNMFTSSFTPFDIKSHPNTLKVTSTSQEWCGTTFTQLNKKKRGYNFTIRSYFELEGDSEVSIPNGITEEEIFTKIRFGPNLLPTGDILFIPSGIVSRLLHLEPKAFTSQTKIDTYKEDKFEGDNLQSYTITTSELQRELKIVFEGKAPYKIVGWTDTYPSVFDKKRRTTVARLTHQIKEPYWNLNSKKDAIWREKLGF